MGGARLESPGSLKEFLSMLRVDETRYGPPDFCCSTHDVGTSATEKVTNVLDGAARRHGQVGWLRLTHDSLQLRFLWAQYHNILHT